MKGGICWKKEVDERGGGRGSGIKIRRVVGEEDELEKVVDEGGMAAEDLEWRSGEW